MSNTTAKQATTKRLGRPPLPPEQRKGPTPVCTLRLAAELHPVLRALHKSGRLEAYLRRAAKAL
jgi:hypothetical protein